MIYDEQFFHDISDTLQFDQQNDSPILEVVVGIDFGTSSTKAIVHVFNVPGDPAFAVPFGTFAHESLQYLLPTKLFVSSDGRCLLGSDPEASLLIDIKVGLMQAPDKSIEAAIGPPCTASATVVATAYLALVLRYVRCWFIANQRKAFGNFSLDWSFNLGLPAAIDDDFQLRETFNSVGKAAWLLSRCPGPVTVTGAQKAIDESRNEDLLCDFDFSLIPEVIAQVIGYARSQFRNEGLHLLMDIGASTIDICSFILGNKDGEDYYPILTADVDFLGAKRLHITRIKSLERAIIKDAASTQDTKKDIVEHLASLLDANDPLCVVPDDVKLYVPPSCPAPTDEVLKVAGAKSDEEFLKKCRQLLGRMIRDLKQHRDPLSPRWSEVFPIFVCGGASTMTVYQSTIDRVQEWLRRFIRSSEGVRRISLPKPSTLEAEINDSHYHRLAVAWGLSYQSFNIGEYDRPSEIEDIPPPPVREKTYFISKDMV